MSSKGRGQHASNVNTGGGLQLRPPDLKILQTAHVESACPRSLLKFVLMESPEDAHTYYHTALFMCSQSVHVFPRRNLHTIRSAGRGR